MSRSGLPPRKKDWKPGTYQVGLFIRMPDNAQVVSVWDLAPDVVRELAMKMLLERFPEVTKMIEDRAKIPPTRVLPDLGDDEDEKR